MFRLSQLNELQSGVLLEKHSTGMIFGNNVACLCLTAIAQKKGGGGQNSNWTIFAEKGGWAELNHDLLIH